MLRVLLLSTSLAAVSLTILAPTAAACDDVVWGETHDLFGVGITYWGSNSCECEINPVDVDVPDEVWWVESMYDEFCWDSIGLVKALDEMDPNGGSPGCDDSHWASSQTIAGIEIGYAGTASCECGSTIVPSVNGIHDLADPADEPFDDLCRASMLLIDWSHAQGVPE